MSADADAAFDAIVRLGALTTRGMPGFSGHLSEAEVETLRQYVRSLAHAGNDSAPARAVTH